MSKFGKSKFRNGQRISNDAKWTEVDMWSASGKYRSRRSSGGILAKALGKAVRQSVRESLKPPKAARTYTPRYTSSKPIEGRTTLTIDEMPPELRYLSYPHLKPKPQVIEPIVERDTYEGSYRHLFD